jgi:hypothetical protein
MTLISAIAANIVVLAAAVGFGSLLCSALPEKFMLVDRLALSLLGGLGVLGILLFCLGQVWFSRTAIGVVVLPGAILGFRVAARGWSKIRPVLSELSVPFLPGAVIAIVVLVTVVGGLAEPTGDIKMDAIAYHYLGPRVWLRDALIRPVPDEGLTGFPATVETIFAALISFGGPRAPAFFAVIALSSLLLLAGSLGRRAGLDNSGAWWVAALIATMPAIYRGGFGGFNDVIYSGFVLAGLRLGFDAQRSRDYLLFGAFCGFAMGTKYTGIIAWMLLVLVVLLLGILVHRQNKKIVAKNMGIAITASLVVAAPWYIRNWVLLGCPIYPPTPGLLRFFDVRYLPAQAIQKLAERVWKEGTGMGRGPLSLLLLPFHLTFHPANFVNGAGGIGLTPLAFAPFGLLARRRDWFAAGLGLFALLQTVAWFTTAQESRYLIPVYIITAVFAVWGWRYVVQAAPRFAPALAALTIACSILYGLFMIGSARADDLRAVLSPSFAERRRHEEIPFLESFEYLNGEPSVRKVLVLNPRVPTYYLRIPYLKPLGRLGEETLPEARDLPKILSEMGNLQITHVLDTRMEGGDFSLKEHPEGLTLVLERSDQKVYRVN